ncbi:MAG: hypothetical protein CMJ83_09425 [Planctomycetes bacterium]|nr:hypothetical protein [Planctomycetota bacterium]
MSTDEQGRVAIVLGGSGGIGRAVARELAATGHDLFLIARNQARLEEAAKELRDTARGVRTIAGDLADPEAVREQIESAAAAAGRLDVLVNAWGGIARDHAIRARPASIEDNIRDHLVAPMVAAKSAALSMKRSGGGLIIQLGSIAANEAIGGAASYGAAKAALLSASRSLQREVEKHGVKVTVISPDRVDTPLHGEEHPESSAMLRPEDVAEAVGFVLRLSPTAMVEEVTIRCRGDR